MYRSQYAGSSDISTVVDCSFRFICNVFYAAYWYTQWRRKTVFLCQRRNLQHVIFHWIFLFVWILATECDWELFNNLVFKPMLKIECLNLLCLQGEIRKKILFAAKGSESMVVFHFNLPRITKFGHFTYFFDATDGMLIEYN